MRIKNVNGSSKVAARPPKPYNSWLEYWGHRTGIQLDPARFYRCPSCDRSFKRDVFDGCHVQKADGNDLRWYIVPLCSSCNHREGILDIGETPLVPSPSNL